ncbi:S8 family peptidase [Phreatobacter stygius]|uniref:S8 family peptidase n=1 Tax=Phreatobacter stygius TaxID=1940610 RepID=UPI001FE2AF40|nr:autotransporter domain-containing protein [Phreatobacter stygius]
MILAGRAGADDRPARAAARPVVSAPSPHALPPATARRARAEGRALLSGLIEQIRLNPASRDRLTAAAVAVSPLMSAEIDRAAEIGRLLAERSGTGRADPLAPATATRFASAAVATTASAPGPVGARAAPATFPYLTDNGTVTATPRTEQPWMATRTGLDGSYTADQKREFAANWGNLAVGQGTALNATTRPDGTALPGKGLTGRGVTVAVIDTGLDATFNGAGTGFSYLHPEFAGRLDTRSRNTVDSATGSHAILDDAGHGTHVAGSIAAGLDGHGMVGVAPGANLLVMKSLGDDDGPDRALMLIAAMSDVRVINGSYGPTVKRGAVWDTDTLDTEWQAVRSVLAAGKVLVMANGNDGNVNPSGIALFPFITPANARAGIYNDGGRNYDFSVANSPGLPGRIVAVANLGIDLTISEDSNRCGVTAAWCISAPGGGTGAEPPSANETLSTVQRGNKDPVFTAPNGATYGYMTGTSMAAPHVSGVIAVLMEAYPDYSAAEIVRLMFATAQDLGAPGIDAIYGHGLVRLDRALAGSPAIGPTASRTTTVAAGQIETWTAPVSTTGTLTIDNAAAAAGPRSSHAPAPYGQLQIAGEAQFGAVDVRNGQLSVDGTLRSPTITVFANGHLGGFGEIFGNVTVHGTLKPGHSPGELFITGNVAMGQTGIYQVDIDGAADTGGPGSYDTLFVLGAGHSFAAGGTFQARFRGIEGGATNSYVPTIGSKFTVVRAEAGARVTGRFGDVEVEPDAQGLTGLPVNSRLDVLYYPTSVVAAVTPASFANLAQNGISLSARQSAVAGALDRGRPAPGAAMSGSELHVYDLIYGLAPAGLQSAFDEMSGRGYGGMTSSVLKTTLGFGAMLQQRRDGLRSGSSHAAFAPSFGFMGGNRLEMSAGLPSAAPASADGDGAGASATGWSLWGQAFGNTTQAGADRLGSGWSSSGGGIVIGVDRLISPSLLVGVSGFYANDKTRSTGFTGTSNTFAAAVYGSWTLGRFEADAAFGGGWTEMSADRSLNIQGIRLAARGATQGFGLLATAEIGYRFSVATALGSAFLKPFAGFAYADINRGAFGETGAGGFNLTVLADRPSRALAQLGLSAGLSVTGAHGVTWRPELRLAWGHDFKDPSAATSATLLGQTFTTKDASLGRDAALVGVQIAASRSDRLQVYAGYNGEFRGDGTSHQGRIGARLRW